MQSDQVLTETDEAELQRGALGIAGVVFLVLAAAAPMAAVVAVVPVGIALGDGKGFVGIFVVVALVLLLFAVGYAAMSKHVTNAGAFYSYVARGLGREAGSSAGFVALVAYSAMAIALSAGVGFFAHATFLSQFSIDLPWGAWWAIGVAIVGLLAYREIGVTARVLGLALIAEIAILLVFDAAVLLNHGFQGFSLSVLAPSAVFSGAVGVALTYGFSTFVGFEATAIYSEETKNPTRTVARATYIALAVIGIFYALTTWAAVSSFGTDQAQRVAGKDPSVFVFAANQVEVGKFTTDVMQVLVVTSLFAGFLAFHQAASRYMFSLARDGLLPRSLARTHPRHHSPYIASALQLSVIVAVVGALGLAGRDPYLEIAAPILGLGTLGIIVLQAWTSVSVVAFFRQRRDPRLWQTVLAPILASCGLIASAVLVVINFDALTGSASGVVQALPWLYLGAAVVGFAVAAWMRNSRPGQYRSMGESHGIEEPALPAAAR